MFFFLAIICTKGQKQLYSQGLSHVVVLYMCYVQVLVIVVSLLIVYNLLCIISICWNFSNAELISYLYQGR